MPNPHLPTSLPSQGPQGVRALSSLTWTSAVAPSQVSQLHLGLHSLSSPQRCL